MRTPTLTNTANTGIPVFYAVYFHQSGSFRFHAYRTGTVQYCYCTGTICKVQGFYFFTQYRYR